MGLLAGFRLVRGELFLSDGAGVACLSFLYSLSLNELDYWQDGKLS
jgi:hypothetical protein